MPGARRRPTKRLPFRKGLASCLPSSARRLDRVDCGAMGTAKRFLRPALFTVDAVCLGGPHVSALSLGTTVSWLALVILLVLAASCIMSKV